METRLTQLLNIEHPIICGGMSWIGMGELAAAVSEAGGLGIIAAGTLMPDLLRAEIHKTRTLTKKPFGVNVQLKTPFIQEVIQVLYEEKVAVVTTGNGDPRLIINKMHACGTKVIPVVPNLRLARRLEPEVDGIILEGVEAGGHVGNSTTMALMSIVLPEITTIPVIAAGGFADGRGLAAALIMGAAGIQMGTAFLFAPECPIHENTRKLLIEADDIATFVTGNSINDGVRGIKNKFSLHFYQREISGASKEELVKLGTGAYKRGMIDGDIENGSISPGIVCARFHEIRPAGEIVRSVVCEAEHCLCDALNLT